jgi:hypothetical protein
VYCKEDVEDGEAWEEEKESGVRALEGVLKEQEAIKHEVGMLRSWWRVGGGKWRRQVRVTVMESWSPGAVLISTTRVIRKERLKEGGKPDDDDNTLSINTVVPHELDPVEEEDIDQLALAAREELELEHADEGEPDGEEDDDEEDRRWRRESWDVRELRSQLGWGWGYMGWTITSRVVSLRLHDDILPLPRPPCPVPNLQPTPPPGRPTGVLGTMYMTGVVVRVMVKRLGRKQRERNDNRTKQLQLERSSSRRDHVT